MVFPGENYELAPVLAPQEDDDLNALNGEQSLVQTAKEEAVKFETEYKTQN